MKKISTIFLQIAVILVGISTLTFMFWEPHIEGRNAHATLFDIYLKDPFLAYTYITSILFFVALYQAFKLLRYIRQNKVFSQMAIKALQTIKYCAISLVGFIVIPEAYLFIARPGDDIAGGVVMGLLLIFIFAIIATAAATFESILQNAINIKSENDLLNDIKKWQ